MARIFEEALSSLDAPQHGSVVCWQTKEFHLGSRINHWEFKADM